MHAQTCIGMKRLSIVMRTILTRQSEGPEYADPDTHPK
ncbi:hypothetical protein NBRC3257_1128 [Gluconobacter thailandicus NBRC 3257]|uniref:Transposase n=1 Tax=Gluconobacter thailandicus NBRC 3257 TaxID=1381097 RepID=A0ABQ0IV94_GLUTH|nr:hypothetical protein NBRC3255_0229 [Gluconobacter thailandicus NBRC 3255]GAD26129.1 hypothetical protein NBRC3257_1128 [Gluconobacter thailandicus NBRC 3257]